MLRLRATVAVGLLLAPLCCESPRRDYSQAPSQSAHGQGTPETASGATSPLVQVSVNAPEPLSRERFAALVREGSEAGEYFFSDNLLSNETSYQKPASLLSEIAVSGGAYLGVGPEQNFTYIGLTEPRLAFIVDIRRDNLLQQLWYKALFETTSTRTEFLCSWLGRQCETDPGPQATIVDVLAAVRKAPRSKSAFLDLGQRVDRALGETGVDLSPSDRKRIEKMRQAFFERGLAIRFELHEATSHRYPTLEQVLAETDDQGRARGFLADERAFRTVQSLQKQNRVIPLVGDFAGERTLARVARELEKEKVTVSLFYVSNVEQYLFEGETWVRWVKNLRALPTNERSLIARVHLDQGRPHPRQLEGHRSTTVLQRFEQFFEHQERKPYRDAWQLVTEDLLLVP